MDQMGIHFLAQRASEDDEMISVSFVRGKYPSNLGELLI